MADELPRLVADGFHPAFADFARYMLDERCSVYPRRVSAGLMTPAEARHKIHVMKAIAEIWVCAVDHRFSPDRHLYGVTRGQMIDELRAAIQHGEKALAKRPDNTTARDRVDTLAAMLWWHQHYKPSGAARSGGGPGVYMLQMILNLQPDAMRMMAEAEQRKAAA